LNLSKGEQLHTIAITGATSAIGINLIRECIAQGREALAVVNPDSHRLGWIPEDPHVRIVPCGLERMASFEPQGMKADVLIHLAWAHTKSLERNDPHTQEENIRFSLDAVELADKLGCRVFLGAGSQAEYGKKQEKIRETTVCEPDTPYGIAKYSAEMMTRCLCRLKQIRHVWPRIFSSYGPGSETQTVLSYEIKELLCQRKPELSDGEQLWDFLYLEDAARALLALADFGKDGQAYNVASGKSRKLKEFMKETRDAVDPALPIGLGAIPRAGNTAFYLDADISKIKADTGWRPEVGFEEGIRKTIEWVKSLQK